MANIQILGKFKSATTDEILADAREIVIDEARLTDILGYEAFDESKAYAKGDHVAYGDKFYVFTAAHSAGAWNSSHVAEMTSLQAQIDSIGGEAGAALPKSGGTMTGNIAMSEHLVTGLGAPSADGDAARKKYVDDGLSAKAPNDHSSTGTTYGVGNASKYGHLKLSDSTTGTSDESGGTAATPKAVKAVKDAIPAAGTDTPLTDGTAAAGSSAKWAHEDHRHGTDTSRMAANLKGAANGVAELDANGKVPSSQLPSFVDDVIEGYYYNGKFYSDSAHTTEITGESGKIYVDLSTEKTYRWSGSAFVVISETLALGETSSTAYRGDRGKAAYDHSRVNSGNPHGVTKSDVGLGNVDNTSDSTKKTNMTGSIADGNTGFVTGGDVYTALAGKAPTSHAASDTTYGAGSGSNYGHVKLSDATDSSSGASGGIAATPAAVKSAKDVADAALPKSGGTMSGAIAMGSKKITGLADPTDNGDAANKKYVDDAASGLIKEATGTIGTSATTVTVNFSGTFINAYAKMNGSIVLLDIAPGASSVVFTVAQAPSSAVTCVVVYA